jgi:purine-cytosine permease-like protein
MSRFALGRLVVFFAVLGWFAGMLYLAAAVTLWRFNPADWPMLVRTAVIVMVVLFVGPLVRAMDQAG